MRQRAEPVAERRLLRCVGPLTVAQPSIPLMNLELTDADAEALIQELSGIINNARYPQSPRIQTVRAVLNKLRPGPVRERLPTPRHFEPSSKDRYRRRIGLVE